MSNLIISSFQTIPALCQVIDESSLGIEKDLSDQRVQAAFPQIKEAVRKFVAFESDKEPFANFLNPEPLPQFVRYTNELSLKLKKFFNDLTVKSEADLETSCSDVYDFARQLDRWYWALVYIEQPVVDNYLFCENFYKGDGKNIQEGINKIGICLSTILNFGKIFYYNRYFQSLNELKEQQIYYLAIGCAGNPKQQILPWIFETLRCQPNTKIKIDLFDDFQISGKENEVPFFAQKNQKWVIKKENMFTHQEYEGLKVELHRMFFPIEETDPIGSLLYPYVKEAFKKLLLSSKLVIIGQYTGGNYIGTAIRHLFEDLRQEVSPENNHLNIVIHSDPYGAEVFNVQHPIDSDIKSPSQTLDTLTINGFL